MTVARLAFTPTALTVSMIVQRLASADAQAIVETQERSGGSGRRLRRLRAGGAPAATVAGDPDDPAPSGLTRESVDRWFRRRRIKPRIYGEVPGTEAILALVSLGCGVGVVPKLVADQSPLRSSLQVLTIEQPLSPVRVGICMERKRLGSSVAKAFWESIHPPE